MGASNTYGQGVQRGEDFPAQLESLLRGKGLRVSVSNQGVSGDTTAGMLSRFDSAVDGSTKVLVFQPGGNDDRRGVPREERQANIRALLAKAKERGIRVVMVSDEMYRGLPYQADRMHLTAEGYRALASRLLSQVISALRH